MCRILSARSVLQPPKQWGFCVNEQSEQILSRSSKSGCGLYRFNTIYLASATLNDVTVAQQKAAIKLSRPLVRLLYVAYASMVHKCMESMHASTSRSSLNAFIRVRFFFACLSGFPDERMLIRDKLPLADNCVGKLQIAQLAATARRRSRSWLSVCRRLKSFRCSCMIISVCGHALGQQGSDYVKGRLMSRCRISSKPVLVCRTSPL